MGFIHFKASNPHPTPSPTRQLQRNNCLTVFYKQFFHKWLNPDRGKQCPPLPPIRFRVETIILHLLWLKYINTHVDIYHNWKLFYNCKLFYPSMTIPLFAIAEPVTCCLITKMILARFFPPSESSNKLIAAQIIESYHIQHYCSKID